MLNRPTAFLVLLAALSSAAAAHAQPKAAENSPSVTIHVSPKGRDTNPATAAKPLKTIEAAIAFARTLPTDAPRTILLADGEYPVDESIKIGPKDYRLTIRAAHRGKAVVSASVPLVGWRQDAADGRQLVADVPFKLVPEHLYLLFRGDEPCELATYPERGRLPYDADQDAGDFHWINYRANALPETFDPSSLDLASVWLEVPQEWATSRSYIEENDVAGHRFRMKSKSSMPLGRFNQGFRILNTRLGVASPGRWMFEATAGRIVYCPREGETPENLKLRLTRALCAFEVSRVQSLTLDGLVVEGCHVLFSNGIWDSTPLSAAVSVKCSKRVTIANCEIRNCAGAGVMLLKADRCRVLDSHVHHVGTSCVDFVDGGEGDVEVLGCEFDHGGLLSPSSTLLGLQIERATVMYNHIHDGPGNGAVMWSGNSVFASNHIHHVMKVQRDGGGLYGAYNYTLVKGNHVHDTYGWPCLYADEGSQHTLFTENKCEHWWPTHMHCTRHVTVSNNVFRCPGSPRFSFQGSGGGVFADNKLYLDRDLNERDYISLESCREWARNDIRLKDDKEWIPLGKRSYPCGKEDSTLGVLAFETPGGCMPISEDGGKLDESAWATTDWKSALYPCQLAGGGSMCGDPWTQIKVAYDKRKVYFRFNCTYNAFCGYLGSRNLGGDRWGHWDGSKLFFANGLTVEAYADGKVRCSDPSVKIGVGDSYVKSYYRGVNYAISIPLAAIGLDPKAETSGQEIPFNVCCRNEDHRISAWAYRPKGKNVLTGRLEFH